MNNTLNRRDENRTHLALPVKLCSPTAVGPRYGTDGAAGLDLYADLPDRRIRLRSRDFKSIPTGVSIALPEGYEAQVRPRSGLAAREGVTVLNAPGTIDSDYRGEIHVVLVNHSFADVTIAHHDRIAQLVIVPIPRVEVCLVSKLDETERGVNGFGSTGR